MHSHFFSKKFQHICVSLDVNFNESLTNDVVSFEQLGPESVGIALYMQHFKAKFIYFNICLSSGYCVGTRLSVIVEFQIVFPKHFAPALVAQLDAHPTGNERLQVQPSPVRQYSFVEIDHEIFSVVILSCPLIQEGQLSVSG